MLPSLLTQIPGTVCQVSGNEAYDTTACYDALGQRGVKATIPPQRHAKQQRCDNSPEKPAILDANLRQIQQHGRYAWRVASGCTRQRLAEITVFRFKPPFDPNLQARRFENQKAEGLMTCDMFNRIRSWGMPVSERIFSVDT